jgi:RimJ/RimL family protein N-acetyltransferase/GNAT superfamily N-acetyltransferase
MPVEVVEESITALPDYASVPIAFEVRELFDARDLAGSAAKRVMTVRALQPPVVKDYDAIALNGPRDWPWRFDLKRWNFFSAQADGERVGGAAVEFETSTLAVLWDIRVAPLARHQGVGAALLRAVEAAGAREGVSWLRVETQNVNLPAYRFYLKHGFTLTDVKPDAYPELPDEMQLVLHKKLAGPHEIPDEITTPRLVLRRWRKSDAAQLKAAVDGNLAHLQAWMPWAMAEPSPLEAIEERIAKFESQFDSGLEWLFGIRSRETGALLGGTGLHPRIGPDGLEIGYWLQSSATGNGYATEASEWLTRVALQQPGVARVQIRCDPKNVPSAAIPRRLGYQHILSVENETFGPTGSLRDTMVWELKTP